MYAQLAGAGAEQIALDSHDVAEIDKTPKLVVGVRDGVFLDIDLQLLAVLHQVREAGFAHPPHGVNAAADLYGYTIGVQFLRRLEP